MTGKSKVVEMYEKEKKDKPGKFMEFTVIEQKSAINGESSSSNPALP